MGIIGAIVIAWASLSRVQNRVSAFNERIHTYDSLRVYSLVQVRDTSSKITLGQFSDRFVVLDFWAPWSSMSKESHRQLHTLKRQFGDSLQVVAASVRSKKEEVQRYQDTNPYPFLFVKGSEFFNRLRAPGVPSQVILAPGGTILETYVGYDDSVRYNRLEEIIRNNLKNTH